MEDGEMEFFVSLDAARDRSIYLILVAKEYVYDIFGVANPIKRFLVFVWLLD
jgi:hypothetical protein